MIRLYELSKASKRHSALLCEVQRFPHDVIGKMRYYFADGSVWFKFPSSWVAPMIADEVRRFIELVNSPHWLAEIKPNCRYLDDCHNYENDIIPF